MQLLILFFKVKMRLTFFYFLIFIYNQKKSDFNLKIQKNDFFQKKWVDKRIFL